MKWALLVLCALALACPAIARRPARPRTLMLHVTTHLVQVNVIVLDRRGNPVRGLARNDFKVFDNGKPEKIAVFRMESNQPPATPPKLPSNAYSNYAERAGTAPPSVTVILLDALNTPMDAQIYARQQVVKFLKQLQPDDYVALYVLTGRLSVLHDFTTDSAALLEALGHYEGRYVGEMHRGKPQGGFPKMSLEGSANAGSGSESVQLSHLLGDVSNLESDYYAQQRVRITTNALVAIANHLAGVPGRKNLVWVSAGFPLWNKLADALKPNEFALPQDFRTPLARAARALNNVNLAIDPVDARGLMAEPGISVMHHTFTPTRMYVRTEDNSDTMDELARRTGGRAFYNTNGIWQAIRRVVDDSRVTYVLGYYPQDVKWKGEFRKIKVRVDLRRVRLQYRHGYSAMPEVKVLPAKYSRMLDAVVNSPLDATSIGLAVQMLPDKGASTYGGPAYLIRLQIDPKDIAFERHGNLRIARLTLVTDEFGPQGQNLKGVAQRVTVHLKPAIYREMRAQGLGFGERLLIPILFNAARLRVVIRDDSTGQTHLFKETSQRIISDRQVRQLFCLLRRRFHSSFALAYLIPLV